MMMAVARAAGKLFLLKSVEPGRWGLNKLLCIFLTSLGPHSGFYQGAAER